MNTHLVVMAEWEVIHKDKKSGAVPKIRCQEPQNPYIEETLKTPSIYEKVWFRPLWDSPVCCLL
jgi:hypothetical protein